MLLLLSAATAAVPDVDAPLRTGERAPGDAAVVVGIEDYLFLPDVPYARRDAQAVYDWLVSARGVPMERVHKLDGGSREQLVAAVEAAGREAGADGTVWLYFAGHGVAAPSSGERLLLGDDTRQDPAAFEPRGVAVDELERLASAGGARTVVLVDACFNGTGRGGSPIVAGTRFAVPAWTTAPRPDHLTWAAAGPDQLSRPLDAARHGAFTYLALGALRGWADGEIDGRADGRVTADEAQLFLTRSLGAVGVTDQQPVLTAAEPGRWDLGIAAEDRPELDPDAFLAVPLPSPVLLPTAGAWDPGLVRTAAALDVALPLRKGTFGYKDAEGDKVRGDTYLQLVKSTERGRKALGRRTVGLVLAPVGWMAMFGFGTTALVTEDPVWAIPAGGGLGVAVGGIVLLASGQTGVLHAVEPLPASR